MSDRALLDSLVNLILDDTIKSEYWCDMIIKRALEIRQQIAPPSLRNCLNCRFRQGYHNECIHCHDEPYPYWQPAELTPQ